MYVLLIKGPRNATLAYHRIESRAELDDLLAIYRALGYASEQLIVQEQPEQQAA